MNKDWKLIGHSSQIADTGDYDGYYEITNGEMSIFTKDDDDEALQPVVDALNNSGCKFYLSDAIEVDNYILRYDIEVLKLKLAEQQAKMPTEEEIEARAYEHSSFIGAGGLKNNNIAKQVSFMQGARWFCSRMTSSEKPNNHMGGGEK